jgi:RimJ/RimL family protein N-acetyltransferase
MNFPDSYKVLKCNYLSMGDYHIVPIRFGDRYEIMKWRNEQIYHLRQTKPLTPSDQDRYFEEVVAKLFDQEQPEQILFSYLEGEKCIGYGGLVHINWTDRNAELSFIMDTKLESDFFEFHWSNYLKLIEQVAFEDIKLHKIYTFAFDLRPYLYLIFEKNKYKKEAVLKEHICHNNAFINAVIHGKTNRKSYEN